ncbi:MAG: transcriptional repressor LexA [Omnitrophica bacterium]|nr:transcriptional repressor LexA [Candidatus Omnitrophota bacterium]
MKGSVLTKRQEQIFNFIVSNIDDLGYPPSIPEIQEEFSFQSPNAAQDHLKALERKGYISRRPHKSRGIGILVHIASKGNSNDDARTIPIVGEVAAGTPILAEENIEGSLTIDKTLVKTTAGVFALRVKGDSMINAGILDGDCAIVYQQPTAENGEIVVVLIEDEATLKRFYKEKDTIRLQPENDSMQPITVDLKDNSVRIIGKVIGLIRKV